MTTAVDEDRETLSGVVQRCRAAQRRWQGESARRRLRFVKTLRFLLVAEGDRLCEAIARDIGKPAGEALGEVLNVADACRFLEREAASLLRPRRVPRGARPLWLFGQRDTVHRRPRGVVGIIGTWNYPILLNGVQMAQALTAGNAIIWKPSEVAPATADVLFNLFVRAGFPEGLLHKMPATRAGGAVLVEADLDHLIFTGGVEVGRQIATRLGQRLISSTMEL